MEGSERAETQEAHALFLTLVSEKNRKNNNTSEMIELLSIQVRWDLRATFRGLRAARVGRIRHRWLLVGLQIGRGGTAGTIIPTPAASWIRWLTGIGRFFWTENRTRTWRWPRLHPGAEPWGLRLGPQHRPRSGQELGPRTSYWTNSSKTRTTTRTRPGSRPWPQPDPELRHGSKQDLDRNRTLYGQDQSHG